MAEESKDSESVSKDPSVVKPTKPEKHLKAKKLRKEAKKQAKEEVEQAPQAEVLVCIFLSLCIDKAKMCCEVFELTDIIEKKMNLKNWLKNPYSFLSCFRCKPVNDVI